MLFKSSAKSKNIFLSKNIFFLIIFLFVFSLLCVGCSKEAEYVRDMSEVASRGSFVFDMKNNRDKVPQTDTTLVFNTYAEFCKNNFSNVVLYKSGHSNDKKEWVEENYKAKNERYNSDYFEENSLLVAFFEIDFVAAEQIVHNVTFDGDSCAIEVAQYCSVPEKTSDATLYACFIETKRELSADTKAQISLEKYLFANDSSIYCYTGEDVYDVRDPDDETMLAYYIPSRAALEKFIADNEYLGENSTTSAVLKMKFGEEFFAEYSLLFLQLPGDYRGWIFTSGNSMISYRFDTDHYKDKKSATQSESLLNHTAVAFVPTEKNLEADSLVYSFESFSEWEEDVVAENTQSGEITLVRVDNGEEYVTFVQQGK